MPPENPWTSIIIVIDHVLKNARVGMKMYWVEIRAGLKPNVQIASN